MSEKKPAPKKIEEKKKPAKKATPKPGNNIIPK